MGVISLPRKIMRYKGDVQKEMLLFPHEYAAENDGSV